MKKLLKFPNALILAGALLALQTSCSKEKTQSSNPKQLKTALAKSHDDVVNFKDAYDDWANGTTPTYSSLSMADAEWILEAAFNFDNRFVVSGSNDTLVAIEYTMVEEIGMDGDEGSVAPDDLFNAYEDMIDLTTSLSDKAPMSDVWITEDGPGFRIHLNVALEDRKYLNPFAKTAYSDYHFSVGSYTSGPGASYCPGTTGSDYAWEILQKNLGVDFDPPLSNGYFTDVYRNDLTTYGTEPDDLDTYKGNISNNSYVQNIYGAHTSIYSSTFADGDFDQCIPSSKMSDYETGIYTLVSTEKPSGLSSHVVTVTGHQYSNTLGTWAHHEVVFTWALFTTL